ncbi:DASH complex subunit Dam1-domain-containing protein [Apodospora peruviana]|uniref:DASH complex subunit DAM1 n=1 Tax=Apodospora peruviana TaxID=516989 RepID=A0AAE0M6W1_9PEZI|nr:DASH complex subunit Dam1-domain-containing protein [Apodospora peruviana]
MASEDPKHARSTSRTRTSRPTTPLRPSSRSSFRESASKSVSGDAPFPLNTFEPAFAELSDAMADLEANMMHFQIMHESLARFSESFASFMYGLNMNAFCVDFPEGPLPESFRRMKQQEENQPPQQQGASSRVPEKASTEFDGETTFMTTDTSFVDNPTTSSKPTPKKFQTQTPGTRQSRMPAPSTSSRGGTTARGGRGGTRGARPSGLARARGRGCCWPWAYFAHDVADAWSGGSEGNLSASWC